MSVSVQVSRRPTLAALTGLRFVAAIWVVLYHVVEVLAPRASGMAGRVAVHGYLGVSLFFVLSGFILTYTYIDPGTGWLRGSRRSFWWARVARIYPVYALALLLALPVFLLYRIVLAAPAARPDALLSAGLTPMLLQAWWPKAACQWNCPGWSLSVELVFYGLFPLAAVWLARRRASAFMLGTTAWVASLLLPAAYLALAPDGIANPTRFDTSFWLQAVKFSPIAHLGEFALGIVAGIAFLRRKPASFLESPAFGWMAGLGVAISLILLTTTEWLPYVLLHDGLLAPLWAAVILTLAVGQGGAVRLLGSPPLVRLGEASYALYLVHFPLLGYVVLVRGFLRIRHPELTAPSWLMILTYIVGVIAFSVYLFHRVEEPARHWIRERTSAAVRSVA